MQSLAKEMNLSETAFLLKQDDGYDLRWFTPKVEVDLCGHATLASAHILWEEGYLDSTEEARFHTKSGLLSVRPAGEWYEMDFPSEPPTPAAPPQELVRALGISRPRYVGRNRLDYIVEVEREAGVRAIAPDFELLSKVSSRGVIITAPATTEGFDFVSRYFAPAQGINEDPATGSSFCCLTPYWAERTGRNKFTAFQASSRGAVVKSAMAGHRVKIMGQATTILKGHLS